MFWKRSKGICLLASFVSNMKQDLVSPFSFPRWHPPNDQSEYGDIMSGVQQRHSASLCERYEAKFHHPPFPCFHRLGDQRNYRDTVFAM